MSTKPAAAHDAIIDSDTWEQVQQRLERNRAEERFAGRGAAPSLLTGLVYDHQGERLTPTHAVSKERRYRYYVSKGLLTDAAGDHAEGLRLPANDLEQVVWDRLRQFLRDESALLAALQPVAAQGLQLRRMLQRGAQLAEAWPDSSSSERRGLLLRLVSRVTVQPERLELALAPERLAAALSEPATFLLMECPQFDARPIILAAPIRLQRAGLEMRLVVHGPSGAARPNPALINLIVRAQQLRDRMERDNLGIGELADGAGLSGSYLVRLVRLGFLAPDIVGAILDGRQPVDLTANTLLLNSHIPLSWAQQRQVLGFG